VSSRRGEVKGGARRSESDGVPQPRILAGFVQATLAGVPEPARAGVRARLAPAALATLEGSSRLSWLPIEVDVELTRAIYAELGSGRARELFRRSLSTALEAPILHSLVQGALRIFGATPERFYGWAPKAYAQLYRDAGEMRFECDEPGSARLELSGLPSAAASGDYLDGMSAAVAAGFDVLGVKGEVTLSRLDAGAGTASFRLLWEEPDDPVETLPVPAGA
jgi:hypothetical protein